MFASMSKQTDGISIDPVLTRRSMVLVGLHGSNCHHRLTICASNVPWSLNSILRTVIPPPDATNDQGIGGHAYLDPSHVVYDWKLRTSNYRFVIKLLATYTMTNSDGSLFDSGTFYITEDTTTSLNMNSLITSCFINSVLDMLRFVTSHHLTKKQLYRQ